MTILESEKNKTRLLVAALPIFLRKKGKNMMLMGLYILIVIKKTTILTLTKNFQKTCIDFSNLKFSD